MFLSVWIQIEHSLHRSMQLKFRALSLAILHMVVWEEMLFSLVEKAPSVMKVSVCFCSLLSSQHFSLHSTPITHSVKNCVVGTYPSMDQKVQYSPHDYEYLISVLIRDKDHSQGIG